MAKLGFGVRWQFTDTFQIQTRQLQYTVFAVCGSDSGFTVDSRKRERLFGLTKLGYQNQPPGYPCAQGYVTARILASALVFLSVCEPSSSQYRVFT